MNFEPEKFFISLMDFFSILLPGALLTYLLMGNVGPLVLGDRYSKVAGAEAWAAFLFASYLFGHLAFLLGSWLDEFYDWARRYTLNTQIAMLARRGQLLPWLVRVLIWLVFKAERNLAVDRAGEIKQQALGALQARDAINNFRWCKVLLNAENPASPAVVQRFEADSKFFRYFTVVLLLLLAAWPLQHRWPLVGLPMVLVLLRLALSRYMEQRFKATNQAYWSVITLTALRRPVGLFLLGTDATNSDPRTMPGEVQYEKTEYGEGQPNDQKLNLRARIFRLSDAAGIVSNVFTDPSNGMDAGFDFKGDPLRNSRQFIQDHKLLPDWSKPAPVLLPDKHISTMRYDVRNRVIVARSPEDIGGLVAGGFYLFSL